MRETKNDEIIEDAEQIRSEETKKNEEDDGKFEEVIPRRRRKISLINEIFVGAIIVCIVYFIITITGEYNSFSDREVMDIRTAVMHERVYGKMDDSDWEKISKMKIKKTTLDDGYIKIENSRRGTLLFGFSTQEPSVYKPELLKRFWVNLPLFFGMLIVTEIISLIIYIIIYYNRLYKDDYYDDDCYDDYYDDYYN